jgi:hypothetical protein
MNYINQLQDENKELKAQIKAAEIAIQEFRTHLTIPKFWEDTTIQVSDVDMRLLEIMQALHSINA